MQTTIKVGQLSRTYDDPSTVDKINLSVKCGTVYGLLGANGAGKSTTMECILGTKNADNRTVSVLNCNPQEDRRHLFQKVDIQFQEGGHQPEVKVSELYGETTHLYETPADWKSLCGQFGIGSRIDNAVKNLSGDEHQQSFIVLALIPNPDLVFLGELTTGLDAKARHDVWKILQELKQGGLTIFLTSHFMDEVEILCDEVCILKRGKAAFYGTVEQVKTVSGCEKFEDAYLMLPGGEVGEWNHSWYF